MRILGFALALAFVVAAPSLAGSADGGLPGAGAFSYNGAPIVAQGHQRIAALAR